MPCQGGRGRPSPCALPPRRPTRRWGNSRVWGWGSTRGAPCTRWAQPVRRCAAPPRARGPKLAAARHRACDRADNPLHMVLEGQTLYGEQHQKQKNQELGPCFHANRATLLCRERAATCRDAVDGLPDVEHILARKGNRARTLEDFACRRFRVQCRIKTCIWAKGSYLRKAPGCMQL